MNRLSVPRPYSAGMLLTYKCNSRCKHCIYACSPGWKADWISEQDAEQILKQLATSLGGRYADPDLVGVNRGVHFTGGEPFLNYGLLLKVTRMAQALDIPSSFVETNCFWCTDDEGTRAKLTQLKEAGLKGILISANPFLLEWVPFERTERGARIGRGVFGGNAIVYQQFFFQQFRDMGLTGTMPFERYMRVGGDGLRFGEILPGGRISYRLGDLYRKFPAKTFFAASCRQELLREWHIHIDNYCNYIPGYCAGISLGDARELDALHEGIDLDRLPVLEALLSNLGRLYDLGKEYGYREREKGYMSKCHLCVDIRRHLARHGEFRELRPREYYEHLED